MGFRRRRWRDARPEEDKVKINKAIRVPEVRVVNEDGQQLGVMATDTARDIAGRIGLDLVEIAPTAQPPVCKIMDYGRYKYELKKKAASAKKAQHQSQVKEIKFRPQISEHDLDFKLKNARKFLFEGDKVKCTVMFRGREIVHPYVGRELLERVLQSLAEVATQESRPQMEGRTLSMTLAPNRPAIEKIKTEERRAEEREAVEAAEAAEAEGAEE
ncbi:MAG: translation initiation factor IF-3 [Myxococcota bacterium]